MKVFNFAFLGNPQKTDESSPVEGGAAGGAGR